MAPGLCEEARWWMEPSQAEGREGRGTGVGTVWGEKACQTAALVANTRASPAPLDSRGRQGKMLQESLSST